MTYYLIYDVDYEGSTVLEYDTLEKALETYQYYTDDHHRENLRIVLGKELKIVNKLVVEE